MGTGEVAGHNGSSGSSGAVRGTSLSPAPPHLSPPEGSALRGTPSDSAVSSVATIKIWVENGLSTNRMQDPGGGLEDKFLRIFF